MARQQNIPTNPRILISRLSHIGDCILTMPVLCALRRQYPKSFIAWVVEKPSDQLLAGHPALDELIVVQRGFMKSPKSVLELRKKLRQHKFDVTIDPQSLTKSSLPCWLTGASRRIGFGGEHGREMAKVFNNRKVTATRPHLVDRSLELLMQLGIRDQKVEFNLPISMEARTQMKRFVDANGLQNRFAVINPGCSWESRRWEMDRYGQVARSMLENHGVQAVVAWAGDQEHKMALEIESHSQNAAIVAPATSLQELAALSKLSSFYIGSDTGPAHIAAATGVPCIGLFGTTEPKKSGPYGEGHIPIQAYYQTGTSRQRRSATNEAMKEISVAEVNKAVDQMVAQMSQRLRSAA